MVFKGGDFMSETIPYVYVFSLVMIWRAMSDKKRFSFQIYQLVKIKNKNCFIIEKGIMVLLPIMIAIFYCMNVFDLFFVKLLLIGVVFVDFLLQYLYKYFEWLETDKKLSKEIYWWFLFMGLIFIMI